MDFIYCSAVLLYIAGIVLLTFAVRPLKGGLYPLVANRPWLRPVLRVSWGTLVMSVATLLLPGDVALGQRLLIALVYPLGFTWAEVVGAGWSRLLRTWSSRKSE